MKKLVLVLFFAIGIFASSLSAQGYKTSIGVRTGNAGFFGSIKHFISEQGAVEAYVGPSYGYYGFGFSVSAAYQHHFPIGNVENLSWYVGGGATAGIWTNVLFNSGGRFGIQGYGGADYRLKDAPFNFSADIVPTIYFGNSYIGYRNGYVGVQVAARYILGEN